MKPCRYCKNEFKPNRDWQKDCTRECHYQYWKEEAKRKYQERKKLKVEPQPEPVVVQ